MKKLLVWFTLILAGLVTIAACGVADTVTPTSAATPDQTGTAESLQAAADTSLDTAAVATETQLASLIMITETPQPSAAPTLEPTLTATLEPG